MAPPSEIDMRGDPPERFDVAVVGAGQAGLAMGYFLAAEGRSFVILEAADSLGAAWKKRWASLVLFTPRRYDGLPGLAFPGEPDGYPGRDEVVSYLNVYAKTFALPVALGSGAWSMAKVGQRFILEVAERTIEADAVVVATGPFQTPRVPGFAAALAPEVFQVHSAGYRAPSEVPAGTVLVVGGGNTGFQIAAELSATHTVHLAIGARQAALPQRLLGRDLFWWLTKTRVLSQHVTSRIGRRMSARDALIGSSRRSLRRHGVATEARATGASGRTVTFADGTELAVDAVIWASGFGLDHSWIDLPVTTADGAIRHRRGVTATPGLYFLGLPLQHTRGSALLGWVKDDAEYIAAQITALRAETRSDRPQFHPDGSPDVNDMDVPSPSDPPGETAPLAGDRDQAGLERDQAGEWRDHVADERDVAAGVRDQAGRQRDRAAHERDLIGDQRDAAGEQRDRAAYDRDQASARRDLAGDRRDEAAAHRDHLAEQRDLAEAEGGEAGATDILIRSALARQDAASDRRRAAADRHAAASGRTEAEHDRDAGASERIEAEHDRDAGASERTESGHDRGTADADRGAGAGERVAARTDRTTALTDRGASARERVASSLDELTGAYLPAAGFIELDREMARSRRMGQPLTLVAVDVEDLETVNGSHGRSAGDQMLVDVAETIASIFRPYDVVIRAGDDEFVCAISGLGMEDATKRLAHVETALAALPGGGSVTTGFAALQPGDSREDVVARAEGALQGTRHRPEG